MKLLPKIPTEARGRLSPAGNPKREGFALIIAISLMAFILLLLLTMATLVQVESASADKAVQMQLAREHARYGALVALGQVQRTLGPDQRISATADLLNVDPTAPVTQSQNRHWVGVWNAENNPAVGAVGDHLQEDMSFGSNTGSRQWLISDAGTALDPAAYNVNARLSAGGRVTSADDALLVGRSSVGIDQDRDGVIEDPNLDDFIVAEKVTIEGHDGASLQPVGRFAWWVGDEGSKARLNLENPHDPADPNYRTYSLSAPQKTGLRGLQGFNSLTEAELSIDSQGRGLITTRGQAPLLAAGQRLSGHFHDLSVSSAGLLINTRDGGFKTDLSYELDAANSTSLLNQYMFSVAGRNGPRWNQLLDYYQNVRPTGGELRLAAQTENQHGVTPILTHFQLWHAVARVGNEARFYTLPAFVLQNPYRYPLRLEDLYCRVSHKTRPDYKVRFMQLDALGNVVSGSESIDYDVYSTATSGYQRTEDPHDFPNFSYRFPNVTLAPGEARVFSPAADAEIEPNPSAFSNQLVDDWNIGVGFYEPLPVVTDPTAPGYYDLSAADSYQIRPAANSDDLELRFCVGVNTNDWFTHWNTEGNIILIVNRLGAWGMSEDDPRVSGFGMEPAPILDVLAGGYLSGSPAVGYTHTLRMVENRADNAASNVQAASNAYQQDINMFDDIQWLAHYNPRAAFQGRSPLEWQTDDISSSFEFKGSLTDVPNYVGAYTDSGSVLYNIEGMPSGGGYRGFFGFSDAGPTLTDVVLFDIVDGTTPVVSIGELMHANLNNHHNYYAARTLWAHLSAGWPALFENAASDYNGLYHYGNYQPAYAIGNSMADPRIPLDRVHLDWTEWFNSDSAGWVRTGIHYDMSWHLNDLLWDNYFFSSVPQAGSVSFPLAQGQLKIFPGDYNANVQADPTQLRAADCAHDLLLDGSFNVNSTSVEAWAALLGSFLGIEARSGGGDNDPNAPASPFARVRDPLDGPVDPYADDLEDAVAYGGFRQLSINPADPATDEIRVLAESIVSAIRRRARSGDNNRPIPFSSLADFVNRSLSSNYVDSDPTAPDLQQIQLTRGVLQEAIDLADLDPGTGASDVTRLNEFALDESGELAVPTDSDASGTPNHIFDHAEGPVAQGIGTYLTQADLLAKLGPALGTRSDTFLIRSYGEVQNPVTEEVESKAWCELVVQRIPEYMDSAAAPETSPAPGSLNEQFGRRFIIKRFRWLSEEDV